jgi:pimeloyl-ACP methyl ester carboxylesterase
MPGKSKGNVETATSADYANDVETSIEYLKTRPEINVNKIGLIGHSEGGLIAPIVAARRKDINYIVLLAGPGIKGGEILSGQLKAILKTDGMSDAAINSYESLYNKVMAVSAKETDTATALKQVLNYYNDWKKTSTEQARKELGFTSDDAARTILSGLVKAFSGSWIRYFINSDAASLLQKTDAKVLALNGEKDLQVLAEANIAGIKEALRKSKSRVYETQILPGLNHLFQRCKTCSVNEYGQLEETFSPEALKVMGDWLKANVQ